MQESEPSQQVKNYYIDVKREDAIAGLNGLFGVSREDSGARLVEYMPSHDQPGPPHAKHKYTKTKKMAKL